MQGTELKQRCHFHSLCLLFRSPDHKSSFCMKWLCSCDSTSLRFCYRHYSCRPRNSTNSACCYRLSWLRRYIFLCNSVINQVIECFTWLVFLRIDFSCRAIALNTVLLFSAVCVSCWSLSDTVRLVIATWSDHVANGAFTTLWIANTDSSLIIKLIAL